MRVRKALVVGLPARTRDRILDLFERSPMEMDFEEPEDALRRLAESAFDLLIVYAGTGPDTASRLFEKAESAEPRPLRFVLTERPSIEEAVEFANAGAEGYLFAPFDPGRSGPAMEKPDRPRRLPGNGPPGGGSELVEISAAMKEVAERLRLVAPTDATVLLLGESGTGKEVAAKFLHANHPHRRNGPFVAVHCGAVPDTLLESELFGHVRGAFTGADRDRIGRFEQANGGTLFLDEISTMKPEAQVRLLRVLQERQVCRLGSSEARPVDVRVVVASNQDLKRLVEEGSFREDLFFRVSVFPVRLPLLRERLADLPELVRIFAERAQRKAGLGRPKRFSAEALLALSRWSWPGNVRELENAVEYATILSGPREIVLRQDLPPEISGGAGEELPAARASLLVTEEGINLRQAVSNLERELILQSLRLAAGNKARAAELLHLKRTTFLEKLKRLEEEGLLGPLQADLSRPALPASPAP